MPKNKFTVNWSETAIKDLVSIIENIKLDNETIAFQTYTQIKKSVLKLENFPKIGRIVPELNYFNIKSYFEVIHKTWRVIYRIDGKNIYILAVIDSRRNIEDILLNRFLN